MPDTAFTDIEAYMTIMSDRVVRFLDKAEHDPVMLTDLPYNQSTYLTRGGRTYRLQVMLSAVSEG